MDKRVKFRHEFKYLCSKNQLELINKKLSPIMKLDAHAGESNTYRIRSIYFDDYKNSKYYESELGVSPREKWRIRAYNEDKGNISLECKKKEIDKILKKSCKITYEQYSDIIQGNLQMSFDPNNKLLNRFIILMKTTQLKPKVVVGYERKPFVGIMGNVRLTIDFNIYSSPDIDRFFEEDIRKRPILPSGMHMLEVKYDEYIPDYIYRTVQMHDVEKSAFSKYYYSRKYGI